MIDLKMEILVKSNSQTNDVFLLNHFVVLNIMLYLIWTIYNMLHLGVVLALVTQGVPFFALIDPAAS